MGETPGDPGAGNRNNIRRRKGNMPARWQAAIAQAMLARKAEFGNEQDILADFTRPTRAVNHRPVGKTRREQRSGPQRSLN